MNWFKAIAVAAALAVLPGVAKAWPKVCAAPGEGLVFSVWFKAEGPHMVAIQREGADFPSMTFSNGVPGAGFFWPGGRTWPGLPPGLWPGLPQWYGLNSWLGLDPDLPFGPPRGQANRQATGWQATGTWQTMVHDRPTCYLVLARFSEDKGFEWRRSGFRFHGPIAEFSGAGGRSDAIRVVVSSSNGTTGFVDR